ncbi:DUF397 domain-containing protein [Streptomyces sp. MST-110588]|uniref:DUF397 domain-containing protein n=1 Tax=Streptomyces sp. MST-110588 TaxID=2833628 RepID=UPI001F5CF168|nr:DUF397 domain-containing protein [Streptomyces sp. MST-110588]UNO39867.1 DUF397 domain-containing protein [Streptomyces sp. MST-110588]
MTEAIRWQKSSYSGGDTGQNCVELSKDGDVVKLRESDDPGSTITTTHAKMTAFIRSLKNGEFDHFAN